MGKLDDAATWVATSMSISFGSSGRDPAGAIGRLEQERRRSWSITMAMERGREQRNGKGMRGLNLVALYNQGEI